MTGSALSVRITMVSADTERVLRKLTQNGITLLNVERIDDLTVTVFVKSSEYKIVMAYLNQWNVDFRIEEYQQSAFAHLRLLPRLLLVSAIALLLVISIYLPGKILFVSVVGNEKIPTKMILQKAESKGVCFGADVAAVRSESVKNALLEDIPQLQWIGVNTRGCTAVIQVREKSDGDTGNVEAYHVTSIIAATDGIIEEYTVTKGTNLCRVGQAVKSGDVLISAYTDCGILIRATQAEGEVYAQTIRQINAVFPTEYSTRGNLTAKEVNYSLRIGKKLINFDNSSGIYHGSCAKIHKEQYVVLPGGFILPVALIRETVCYYEEVADCTETVDDSFLEKQCENYLLSQLVAGEIRRSEVQLEPSEDHIIVRGEYICREMIGRSRPEEILQGEKKRD